MRNAYPISTINPEDPGGARINAYLPDDYITYLRGQDNVMYENLECVKTVLDDPKRIFIETRSLNDGWACYTGVPETWTVRPQVTATFPDNLVYLVFLNSRRAVYTHRAEPVDAKDRYSPVGWESRFGGVVWRSTS